MTTATAKSPAVLAYRFLKMFESKERKEGNAYGDTTFFSLRDRKNRPGWMLEAIRSAHGGMLPDDWVYDKCHSMLCCMVDCDPENWDDRVSEWADTAVDVYNPDRARWLAANLEWAAEVDEAVEEFGHSEQGIFGDIGIGQYHVIEKIAHALLSAVREQAEA